MVHGGTNFGYTAGANDKGIYRPIITSYDYDAPIAEDGTPTEKYWRFREVIARHVPVPEDTPAPRTPSRVLEAAFTHAVPLADAELERWIEHEAAPRRRPSGPRAATPGMPPPSPTRGCSP